MTPQILAALPALALAVSAAAQSPSAGSGQAYPQQPIRAVVGYAAGGGADGMIRAISNELSEALGQQFLDKGMLYLKAHFHSDLQFYPFEKIPYFEPL